MLRRAWQAAHLYSSLAAFFFYLSSVGGVHLLLALSWGTLYDADTVNYFTQIPPLASGTKYDVYSPVSPPVENDILYPPVYPLFLWAARLLPWRWSLNAVLVQHLCIVAACHFLFLIGKRLGVPVVGLFAGLLFGLTSESLFYAQLLYSEALFAFLFAAYVYAFVHSLDTCRRNRWVFLASVLLGLCIGTKPVCLAFLPVSAAFIFVRLRARGVEEPWRQPTRLMALHVTTVLLMLGAMVLLNGIQFGVWSLKSCNGRNLYNRVVGVCDLVNPDGAATKRMTSIVGGRVSGFWWDQLKQVREAPMTVADSDWLLGRVAWEGLRANFTRYLFCVAQGFWVVLKDFGYPYKPANPYDSEAAYWAGVVRWMRHWPHLQEGYRLRAVFVEHAELVPPGRTLGVRVGNQLYALSRRLVPSGRERLLVIASLLAAGVMIMQNGLLSAPAFVVYCTWGYVLLSTAAEWNSSRYFFPCIGLSYLQIGWVGSRLARWTRTRVRTRGHARGRRGRRPRRSDRVKKAPPRRAGRPPNPAADKRIDPRNPAEGPRRR